MEDLDTLFARREEWQRIAFENIKHNLIFARDNRFLQYDGVKEEHLVIIYGKSQVGKTTLILAMMGIRDADSFREVSETLRAGIPRGNSSTSTAIVYARSEDDRYGCAVTSIDSFPPQEIQSFDKEGMIRRLQEVRVDVENHRANADRILYITIPGRYFTAPPSGDRISVLDMPGIGSRNHKEDEHVRNLMVRYCPIASACIIACRSNDIQSLETLALPDKSNWKRMEHRFVLAVTHAYNDGSIKKYFQDGRGSREKGFHPYVTDIYTEKIRNILGQDNRTKIFPLDMGNSMEQLWNSLTDERDKQELLETQEKGLSSLRTWIVGHRENRLKTAIGNLRDVVERAVEEDICGVDREAGEIRERMDFVQRDIIRTEDWLQCTTGSEGQLQQYEKDYAALNEQWQRLTLHKDAGEGADKGADSLYKQLEKRLKQVSMELSGDQTRWHGQKDEIRKDLWKLVEKFAKKQTAELKPAADICNIPQRSIDPREIYPRFMALWEQSPLTPRTLFGLIEIPDQVYASKLQEVCQDVEGMLNQEFDKLIRPYKKELEKLCEKKNAEIESAKYRAQNYEIRIQQLREETKALEKKLADCESERKKLTHRKEKDQKTLNMYRKYTREAHESQRRELVEKINSAALPEDKLVGILFLGVLDRDYQKVTGGDYGTRN